MRWKISPHGHDPRQIDLLAVIALVILIVAACFYFDRSHRTAAQHHGLHRAEPERALVDARALSARTRRSRACGCGGLRLLGARWLRRRRLRSVEAVASGRRRLIWPDPHRQQQVRSRGCASDSRCRNPSAARGGTARHRTAGSVPGNSPIGPSIVAEREEPPLLRIVIAERNAGIVLDDGGAVGEQEVAHRGEVAGVQEIGRALDQAVAGRERLRRISGSRST